MKEQKAITLLALIITVVVMLVLVAVSINILVESDLIGAAEKAGDKYKEEQQKEQTLGQITIGNKTYGSIDEYLNGALAPDEPTIPTVTPLDSSYTKKGSVYCNSPDLSGFNPANTYYVTYDENGENEQIAGRIDRIDAPSDWYDYENKKWANVVTVTGNDVTYWVWIPRYKYTINSTAKTVDAKFVDTNDVCKMISNEEETTVDLTGYTLPDAFTFGEENLKGYWVSKYEVQVSQKSGIEMAKFTKSGEDMIVTTSNPSGTYTIYVDGLKYKEKVTLPYTIENVRKKDSYDISIVSETTGIMIGNSALYENANEKIEIDLSSFNPDCTYYVTYDENGENEQIGSKIVLNEDGEPTNMPDDWYDYGNKKWANIVTINNNLTTYWTYIPRYEYMISSVQQEVLIKFISVDDDVDSGYTIPDAFTFGGEPLKGYWVSKYEVQGTIE